MMLDDLGDRLFADVPEVASILGRDPRTIRRAAAAGEIPAERIGSKWMIKIAWLREQAGQSAASAVSLPDLDELADRMAPRVADLVFARFAALFAGRVGGDTEAA
jgi:excisionase family DNA binding protein